MNTSQIFLWCKRNKLKPPKNILKKDLVQWCESQYLILYQQHQILQEKQTKEFESAIERNKKILEIESNKKSEKIKKYNQELCKEVKKKADAEWEARLDAYLRHTLPLTYGNKEKIDTDWRKPKTSLLDVIELNNK